jgi:hypothetical protein
MNTPSNESPVPDPTPPRPRNPNGFVDPWEDLVKTEKTRTTIEVSNRARADLQAVYPKKGVLQITINLLIEKLVNELKRTGLTSYSPEQYERALAGTQLALGGCQYVVAPDGKLGLIVPGSVTPNSSDSTSGSTTGRSARVRKTRKPE